MATPTTTLDGRFSAPGTAPTSWADARQVLAEAQLCWITTVRADGRPHVTPLVAVWLDEALHFSTGAGEQKGVNLVANPTVVLAAGPNRWDGGLDVVVEGRAVRVTDEAVLARLAEAWTTKWDGSWRFEVRDGAFRQPGHETPALVYRVVPEKVLAFGQGTFTQTRHRF